MAILVKVPTPLRRMTGGKASVETDGRTVQEVLQDLDAKCPGIHQRLYDGNGLRRFINIYLNDEDIRFLQGETTPVKEGDRISIVPAIAGGTRSR